MDARTPPPISLDDLDRAELLYLARQSFVLLRPRDLWRARWEIAMERSLVAGQILVAAAQAAARASAPASGRGAASFRRHAQDYDRAEAAYRKARQRAARADRAENAAWVALEACR